MIARGNKLFSQASLQNDEDGVLELIISDRPLAILIKLLHNVKQYLGLAAHTGSSSATLTTQLLCQKLLDVAQIKAT